MNGLEAKVNAEGKKAIGRVLNALQEDLNEYVQMINEDKVTFTDDDSVFVAYFAMKLLIAVNGHMHMDKMDDYDTETLEALNDKITEYATIRDVCEKHLYGEEE